MSFTEYLVIKAFVLVLLAFVYGFIQGVTGRPLQPARRDKP